MNKRNCGDPILAKLLMIGAFPPPLHGVSWVNKSMRDLLNQRGVYVTVVNTSTGRLGRSIFVRWNRVIYFVGALGTIWNARNLSPSVYMSLSGAWGLLYEAVVAWFARVLGARVVVHHNSYNYIDKPRVAMRIMATFAGSKTLHVAVDLKMAQGLRSIYSIQRILVVSNAAFIPLGDGLAKQFSGATKVGYLCNLSFEKGIADFIATVRLAEQRNLNTEFFVAGPFENHAVENYFRTEVRKLSSIKYLGPLYGADKTVFFKKIDIFAFPTRYHNEAEPLVVLEAMSQGCAVIAYGRGVVPYMIGSQAGVVVPVADDFATTCCENIEKWGQKRQELAERGRAASYRFTELRAQAVSRCEELISYLERKTSQLSSE